jgi:hypothetical protein
MADRAALDFGFKQPLAAQFEGAARWQAQAPERRWIFILDEAMGDCVERALATHVGHANRRDWWLFQANAVHAGCRPAISERDEQDAHDTPDP